MIGRYTSVVNAPISGSKIHRMDKVNFGHSFYRMEPWYISNQLTSKVLVPVRCSHESSISSFSQPMFLSNTWLHALVHHCYESGFCANRWHCFNSTQDGGKIRIILKVLCFSLFPLPNLWNLANMPTPFCFSNCKIVSICANVWSQIFMFSPIFFGLPSLFVWESRSRVCAISRIAIQCLIENGTQFNVWCDKILGPRS